MTSIHRHTAKILIIGIIVLTTPGARVLAAPDTATENAWQTSRPPAAKTSPRRVHQQTLLVKFKADCPRPRIEEINRGIGATVVKVFRAIALWQLRLPGQTTVEEAVRYYQQQPEVVYAEADVAVGIE